MLEFQFLSDYCKVSKYQILFPVANILLRVHRNCLGVSLKIVTEQSFYSLQ